MKSIRVVSALILNDVGEMLMALRRPDGLRPSMWENPGGKVEPGEGVRKALKREMTEELGVDIEIDRHLADVFLKVEFDLEMTMFVITIAPGQEPKPLASVELRWVTPLFAIEHLPCTPATYGFYRDIVAYIERSRR